MSDILFSEITGKGGDVGLITLNRPEALNALNESMCIALYQQLNLWENQSTIKAVVIRGAAGRAFCAGGDIRTIYYNGPENTSRSTTFFWNEYRMNHQIYHFSKPYIAFLDGITMGGGLGVSIHGSHPVVTERTALAMPETGIGLFPDIGASYFLSRCPGKLGLYLALTGDRINAADAIYCELVKHSINSEQIEEVSQALAETAFEEDAKQSVTTILTTHSQSNTTAELPQHREIIDNAFSGNTIEEIIERLDAEKTGWCVQTAKTLRSKSPTSLKLTHQQLNNAKGMTLDDCLQMDYRIVNLALVTHDLYEGVRAAIIDKDRRPNWKPANLADVTTQAITPYFDDLGSAELNFS